MAYGDPEPERYDKATAKRVGILGFEFFNYCTAGDYHVEDPSKHVEHQWKLFIDKDIHWNFSPKTWERVAEEVKRLTIQKIERKLRKRIPRSKTETAVKSRLTRAAKEICSYCDFEQRVRSSFVTQFLTWSEDGSIDKLYNEEIARIVEILEKI